MEKIFNQIKRLRKHRDSNSQSSGAHQRALAAQLMTPVLTEHQQLTFSDDLITNLPPTHVSWIKEVCFGSFRYYHQLQAILSTLLHEPLAKKHTDIHCLLIIGLYQIEHMKTPHHAAVNETVAAVKILNKIWAKGLCNKILRRYIKQRQSLLDNLKNSPEGQYSHPAWLIDNIQTAWPDQWENIIQANNQQAPQFLRVNQQKISRDEYQQILEQAEITSLIHPKEDHALQLNKAQPVLNIPEFSNGFSSVQDISGQRVVKLLDLQPGLEVLDACAAPGSKTCHILETEPQIKKLVAMDIDAKRLLKIKENIIRLGLPSEPCRMVLANACHSKEWWDGELFDRILLDAPCSATGVIRRHPDIKLLRQPDDVVEVVKQQKHLLHSLWPILKPGGKLVYTTCSILPEENEQQIKHFLKEHADAKVIKPDIDGGEALAYGHQCFPNTQGGDGFFYSILEKQLD
ncbi:MAG: hypothetical protein CMF55_04290 [Legionellales bacterium]|nr:hypothetical protein [Legionellales bacterium]|tara:strand:- start:251 stop:1627 length:1377 start_codon:yes stop_codon:yes gene_type:complete